MASFVLWTDGECVPNPGPGGWGFVLRELAGSAVVGEREDCGGDATSSNNRMELTAVLEGLRRLAAPATVEVRPGSTYVSDPVTRGQLQVWAEKGFRRRFKGATVPVKNADLWEELHTLATIHDLRWSTGTDPRLDRRVAALIASARPPADAGEGPVASQ